FLVAALALFVVVGVLFVAFAVVIVGGVGIVAQILAQIEVLNDRPGHAGEGALVVDLGGQPIEVGAGLGLDLGAMKVDHPFGAIRRRLAGQPLAHHQPNDVGERR